jgi:hypothetical protein
MAIFKAARAETLQARMKRARNEGYARGALEAKIFKLAVGKQFERAQGMDWLQTVVEEGRSELETQHAWEREIEAWDISCRVAFLLAIV